MPMNFNLQSHKLKKYLRQDADKYDFGAMIDKTLTFGENKNIILKQAKARGLYKPKQQFGSLNKVSNYLEAMEHHENRSFKSKQMDRRINAKRTFTQDELTQSNYSKWRKHPNQYDIEGIDNRGWERY